MGNAGGAPELPSPVFPDPSPATGGKHGHGKNRLEIPVFLQAWPWHRAPCDGQRHIPHKWDLEFSRY